MINPKQAMDICNSNLQDRSPVAIFDYDKSRYIVSAPLKGNVTDYNGCFFSVNKNSGSLKPFAPGEDYDKFFDAIDNKQIKV